MQAELSLSTVTATQEQVDALLRELLPAQGQWSEEDYLWLTDHTTRLLEFTNGYLEVLPMSTDEQQTMVLLLYELLVAFVRPRGGKVLVAPLRLKIRDGKYRARYRPRTFGS
jgi:Uma2 family endonuclease